MTFNLDFKVHSGTLTKTRHLRLPGTISLYHFIDDGQDIFRIKVSINYNSLQLSCGDRASIDCTVSLGTHLQTRLLTKHLLLLINAIFVFDIKSFWSYSNLPMFVGLYIVFANKYLYFFWTKHKVWVWVWLKQKISNIFKTYGLAVKVEVNKKVVTFLNMTLFLPIWTSL